MTYNESMPVLESSFYSTPTEAPERIADAQTWERVKARFWARIGQPWAEALQSLRFDTAQNGKVVMSVASDSVKAYAAQRHDTLRECWRADMPEVRDVVVNVRSMTRSAPPAPKPVHDAMPPMAEQPLPVATAPPVAVEKPAPQHTNPSSSPFAAWDLVSQHYLLACIRNRVTAELPLMSQCAIDDGTVTMEMQSGVNVINTHAVYVKTLLACWQAHDASVTRLLIKKPAVLCSPGLTVTVSEETDEKALLGTLLRQARDDLIILSGGTPGQFQRIETIQRVVAGYYKVAMVELISQRKTRIIVLPRQVAMYLAKVMTPRSFPEIGRRFGGRDHTTVLHAVRKIDAMLAADEHFAQEIELLKSLIESD